MLINVPVCFTGEKHVRDKAVASLSRFLAGTKVAVDAEEPLEVGSTTDADWDEEWSPDARLAPLEMSKLWKGIWFCKFSSERVMASLGEWPVAEVVADRVPPLLVDWQASGCRTSRSCSRPWPTTSPLWSSTSGPGPPRDARLDVWRGSGRR